jgi:hypothetical protein
MRKGLQLIPLKGRGHMEDIDMDEREILIRYRNVEWIHMAQGDCTKLQTLVNIMNLCAP